MGSTMIVECDNLERIQIRFTDLGGPGASASYSLYLVGYMI